MFYCLTAPRRQGRDSACRECRTLYSEDLQYGLGKGRLFQPFMKSDTESSNAQPGRVFQTEYTSTCLCHCLVPPLESARWVQNCCRWWRKMLGGAKKNGDGNKMRSDKHLRQKHMRANREEKTVDARIGHLENENPTILRKRR